MQPMSLENVVHCIKKPPNERTNEEAEALYPWFSKKAELFKTLKPDIVKDILKNCLFTEKPKDSVIIRQGDTGDCFYIMLSGKVSIYINTEAVPDNPEEATVIVSEEIYTEATTKKELDRSKYGNYIASLDAGKSFGELALINKDCIRNASIIADELTNMLVVNRELYNRSLRAAAEAEFQARINFVNRCSLFNKWQNRYRRQAAMSLRKETFHYNMYIVSQGEPINGLIFIVKGMAKVIVDSTQHNAQYPHLHLGEDMDELDRKEAMAELGEAIEFRHDHRPLWEKPLRRQGYAVAEQRQAQKHIEICLVGPGETIGDIEQGLELPTYAQSIFCVQETLVYVLDGKNFDRLISTKRNPSTLTLLRKKAELKLMNRLSIAIDKDIPLIKRLVHKIIHEDKQSDLTLHTHDISPSIDEDRARKWSTPESFIPQQGLLVNLYGPGTVFYRIKMKRIERDNRLKHKRGKAAPSGPASRALRAIMTGIDFAEAINKSIGGHEDGNDEYKDETRRGSASHEQQEEPNDWETSSEHLGGLENRLAKWHSVISEREKMKEKPAFVKLHRPKVEDVTSVYPGKKIFLRPRFILNTESGEIMEAGVDNSNHYVPPTADDNAFITTPGTYENRVVTKPLSLLKDSQAKFSNEGSYLTDTEGTKSTMNTSSNSPDKAFRKAGKAKTDINAKSKNEEVHHQYTPQEYQKLKQLLKKKERQMEVFRSSIAS